MLKRQAKAGLYASKAKAKAKARARATTTATTEADLSATSLRDFGRDDRVVGVQTNSRFPVGMTTKKSKAVWPSNRRRLRAE
jgi:hypothetical protein